MEQTIQLHNNNSNPQSMSTMAFTRPALESSVSQPKSVQKSADECLFTSTTRKHSRKAARSSVVQFNKMVKVATIPHINDFNTDEINLIWYSDDEFTQCRESCMKIIRRMDRETARIMATVDSSSSSCSTERTSGSLKDHASTNFSRCTRGLENFGKSRNSERRLRRLAATDAVLTEQGIQHEGGYNDPEFLRQLYNQISAPCQIEAHLIGLKDQKEALQCYDATELSPRVTKLGSTSKPSSPKLQAVKSSCGRLDRLRN